MNLKGFNLENAKSCINFFNNNKTGEIWDTRYKYIADFKPPWEYRLDEDEYLIIHRIGSSEEIYNEEVYFNYKLNSDGFRSQHFKKLNKEDINILYAGCSFTFGEGLPEEYTYPYKLSEKIKNLFPKKNVQSFNVGRGGSSIHEIVRMCFSFFENYGNPDYLFITLPDVDRMITFIDQEHRYIKMIPTADNFGFKGNKQVMKIMDSFIRENNWLIYHDLMKMLEAYCETNKIKLIWDSWHPDDAFYGAIIWSQINYKYYVSPEKRFNQLVAPLKFNKNVDEFEPNINNLPYWYCGRDGEHPGILWTTYQSNLFFKEVLKYYEEDNIQDIL
jgi:hypothetical protein